MKNSQELTTLIISRKDNYFLMMVMIINTYGMIKIRKITMMSLNSRYITSNKNIQ